MVITKAEAEEQAQIVQDTLGGDAKSSAPVSEVANDLGEAGKCKNCNQLGHGRKPVARLRKNFCSSFDQSCFTCGLKGNFFSSPACRGRTMSGEVAKTNGIDDDLASR